MKSRLAEMARHELNADLRRMTPEQRLAAYLAHCQLMAELHRAGVAAGDRQAISHRRDAN